MKPWFIISFIVFALLTSSQLAIAQKGVDEQLADQYYQNGEYELAAIYYEKLYNENPTNYYYGFYLKSLIELENLKDAEKLVKKHIKSWPHNLTLRVDLGRLYKLQDNNNKGNNQFEEAIKLLEKHNTSTCIQLGRAFLGIGEYQYALKTYQRGEKLFPGPYHFNYHKAEVYHELGENEKMINEYLDLLEKEPEDIQSIQNTLNRTIGFDSDSKPTIILKEQLLRRVQKQPDNVTFADMLIWLHLQQKDFKAAYIQTKALDRRMNEDGFRLVDLAELCISNHEFDIAIKCYEYLISKGPTGRYYIDSKIRLLQVLYAKVTSSPDYTEDDLEQLEAGYNEALNELGRNQSTVLMAKEFAHLLAFYMDKSDEAISLLKEVILTPRIRPQDQALCKIELADILLLKGEIWDASLYYSQVQKAYKYDVLGQQAKFKNAKIYYYTGDFNWAKAQLDVLKGSTSKLISNDALELSLLITDNTGIDTTENPLRMFARADLLSLQHKNQEALAVLDSIHITYPFHALDDEILYKRYEIYFYQRKYAEAAGFLEKILAEHPEDILGDNALYKLAELYQFRLKDTDKAMELYQLLLETYPSSLFVVEARKRFRYLRGDAPDKPQ